ncbi:hypothetical protein BCV70DRAFT_208723 [Testicularia cyperi]|uniref:Uncharacterized protein n=1 Tax=Testicularia cyperi TaxID=1882483 RepID=A0A317XG22_9BASI|nr:hypothetical protein BCV70DRAFT_208723 [Testicularia cyperi]
MVSCSIVSLFLKTLPLVAAVVSAGKAGDECRINQFQDPDNGVFVYMSSDAVNGLLCCLNGQDFEISGESRQVPDSHLLVKSWTKIRTTSMSRYPGESSKDALMGLKRSSSKTLTFNEARVSRAAEEIPAFEPKPKGRRALKVVLAISLMMCAFVSANPENGCHFVVHGDHASSPEATGGKLCCIDGNESPATARDQMLYKAPGPAGHRCFDSNGIETHP